MPIPVPNDRPTSLARRAARLALTAALPLAAAAGPALAADIPGNANTTARLEVSSEPTACAFERAGDRDWYRVRLVGGRDYAVTADADGLRFAIRDAAGRVLLQGGDGENYESGAEFRAPRDGEYFLEIVQTGAYDPVNKDCYTVRVAPDCRYGATTRCRLKVGAPQRRLGSFGTDRDWFRAELERDRTYALTVTSRYSCTGIAIRDGKGAELASATGCYTGDRPLVIPGFRPPASGTYFVVVRGYGDGGGLYDVTLSTP